MDRPWHPYGGRIRCNHRSWGSQRQFIAPVGSARSVVTFAPVGFAKAVQGIRRAVEEMWKAWHWWVFSVSFHIIVGSNMIAAPVRKRRDI